MEAGTKRVILKRLESILAAFTRADAAGEGRNIDGEEFVQYGLDNFDMLG
jgi:hypothetical protein